MPNSLSTAAPLIILPYATSILLKVASSVLGKISRESDLEQLVARYKPVNEKAAISTEQLAVINTTLGHSGLRVTTSVTVLASVAAFFLVAVRTGATWLWWSCIVVLVWAAMIWIWVYTRKVGYFATSGFLGLSKGTWALILFCSFDAALAASSILAAR